MPFRVRLGRLARLGLRTGATTGRSFAAQALRAVCHTWLSWAQSSSMLAMKILALALLGLAAGITAPSSCSITQSSFTASGASLQSTDVTTNEQQLSFSLQVNFAATCTSSSGDTSWVSSSGTRSYYVKGIESTDSKTDTTYYGVEVKDESDNTAFKFGARWSDAPCVSEEFKGTWSSAGDTCDSTGGSIVGTTCRDLFRAVEASICWSLTSPVVCHDTKLVGGTLKAKARLALAAANLNVDSSESTVLDLSNYYSCSGASSQVQSSLAISGIRVHKYGAFLLALAFLKAMA